MLETLVALTFLAAPVTLNPADSSAVPAARESTTAARIVRRFPPVEVRALLHDLGSTETVHLIPGTVLRAMPVDRLADVLQLEPGVVAQGEELHVRGGRAGETAVVLDGVSLNEPLRRRVMEVPLVALRSAELLSGAPDAQFGGTLAGTLNLRTLDPGERLSGEWRWQTDGRLDTHYDRVVGRIGTPLHALGLGVVASGDAMLDDTWLPALRNNSRHEFAGIPLGWRAENRILGAFKLAPVSRPELFSAQVIASRQVHEPYSPGWSLDGWTYLDPNPKASPIFSPTPQPGYQRYHAADHLAMTDEDQLATVVKLSAVGPTSRAGLSLGWLRTRTVTSVGGGREPNGVMHRPLYGNASDRERFYVLWGDYPLYRESGSDVITLRADGELAKTTGRIAAGAAFVSEDVSMRELDWMPLGKPASEPGIPPPLDSLRAFHARAPGGHAYVQGRWLTGGLIVNAGLRGEYFTPGSEARHQTLPGTARGVWSISPRIGVAYPITLRDAFSLAYVRVQQPPARDFLYDQRVAISNRQPLGNPALEPATLVSYEVAVKHLFSQVWALQTSVFYRDVFGQIGARDYSVPEGPIDLRYVDQDESHALGFEWSLIHERGDGRRLEVRYTWMNAWGNESRPEGDPYGAVRSARTPPLGDQPLSWDRRHTLSASGAWKWHERLSWSWSTSVGSPLPWTPKQLRQPLTDFALVNSRRLGWSENTNVDVRWTPPRTFGLGFGLEARNLFDHRGDRFATLDGYPNPVINTLFDDYGAYRTETGQNGGAYWSMLPDGHWVPVHDPRLQSPPRALRASIDRAW